MDSSVTHFVEIGAAILFAIALIHTFSVKYFAHLAHIQPRHAGIWHLLGEVEVVFGFWALVLVLFVAAFESGERAVSYVEARDFTESMFVFAVMVVAGTRPILDVSGGLVRLAARALPLPSAMASYFVILFFVPLLGSFITEPAAMTLAALMLRNRLFTSQASTRLKYATLGVLFVNISIGGTLTPFAAPPVLMVAAKWNWDIAFMMSEFGWRAAIAVLTNSALATFVFRRELAGLAGSDEPDKPSVPAALIAVHLGFLVAIVVFAHHPAIFIGALLFFLGIATAYEHYQDRLILREALLVAFFLSGLVVLGGMQQWWLQPLLMSMDATQVFYGATALTAFTDNAALTYLGSLVEGLSPEFKSALVAGAVTGGGLTFVANAPNPAGASILKDRFPEGAINPLGLFLGALMPTLVAIFAFRLL